MFFYYSIYTYYLYKYKKFDFILYILYYYSINNIIIKYNNRKKYLFINYIQIIHLFQFS